MINLVYVYNNKPSFKKAVMPWPTLATSVPLLRACTVPLQQPGIQKSLSKMILLQDNMVQLKRTVHNDSGSKMRDEILETALKYVNSHGWSEASLKHAFSDLGISDASLAMFKHGGVEIALHYDKGMNELLHKKLSDEIDNNRSLSTPEFLKYAIKSRLELQLMYYDHWAEALALIMNPNVAPLASRQFAHLVDDILFFAGDKSTNLNWYTKRAAIAAVYGMTELYMLQDKSSDFSDSWNFLDRRINDLDKIVSNCKGMEENIRNAGDISKAAFVIGRNMLQGR